MFWLLKYICRLSIHFKASIDKPTDVGTFCAEGIRGIFLKGCLNVSYHQAHNLIYGARTLCALTSSVSRWHCPRYLGLVSPLPHRYPAAVRGSWLSHPHVTLGPGARAIWACFAAGPSGAGFSFLRNELDSCWASVPARDVPCAVLQKMGVFTGVELYSYRQI